MTPDSGIKAPRSGGVIRVSIPASVAYDLGAFQKSIAIIAEQLGCPTCFSGVDCRFQLERAWVINEQLEIRPDVAVPQDPIPSVIATLPTKVSNDLGALQETVARVADRLGCEACCSGFDITFRRELDFVVGENLNILV
jgi:hypothetical protein